MFNDFLSSRPTIGVPVDAGDDGVVVVTSVKTLRINVRSDLAIVVLAWVMIDVGVDMLTDVSVNVVAAAMTALEFTMSASLEE